MEVADIVLEKRSDSPIEVNQESKQIPETSDSNDTAVCIQGILDHLKDHQVIKELEKQTSIPIQSISKPFRKGYCFVKFANETDKKQFCDDFPDGVKVKNRQCKIKEYKGKMDVFRPVAREDNSNQNKRVKASQKPDKPLVPIKQKICPFIDYSREEQLKLKETNCREIITKTKAKILEKECAKIIIRQNWLKNADSIEQIMQPIAHENESGSSYRNKTEYTISKDPEDGRIKVGFVVGRKAEFEYVIVDRDPSIPFISPVSAYIAEQIESILNKLKEEQPEPECDEFDAYNQNTRRGCHRFLLVKESECYNELIVKLVGSYGNEKVKESVVSALKSFGETFNFGDVKLVGLAIENHQGFSSCVPNDPQHEVLVFGERSYLYEKVMGLKFKIPFGAFFQVHTKLSEILYENIKDLMQIDSSTVLLDICAGTGTMGLILGKEASEIIFIESEKASCDTIAENIQRNTDEGNLTEWKAKVKILNKKIEDCIEEITTEYSGKGLRVVAIVDPPRAGLHPSVVTSLRTFRGLDELVFVSCDFSQGSDNLTKLCCEESRKCRGPPFSPISVRPVDIFPATNHYETLVYMKRLYE